MPKNPVVMDGDFTELAKFIGSGQAWTEMVESPYYISELIETAHSQAKHVFDREAAVGAHGLGIKHMFEWGTVGVNEADGTPTLPPTSYAAKLWVHELKGRGKNRKIDFRFRPSAVDVPLPQNLNPSPVAGVPTDKLPKKTHKFPGKAWVIEFGMPVVIKPKEENGVLFIPIGNRLAEGGQSNLPIDKRSLARGYVLTRGPVWIRERHGTGRFTAFWFEWWESQGRAIIDQVTAAATYQGAERSIFRGVGTYAGGRPKKQSFTLQVQNEKSKASALMRAREMGILRRWQQEEFEENISFFRGDL